MSKSRLVFTLLFIGGTMALTGCAPLRDQNGHPVLDRNGNEQYHKAL